MRKPRSALVLLLILCFGLFSALPAEDVLETDYDESETQPYEVLPLISIVVPLVVARTTRAALSSLQLQHGAAFSSPPARIRHTTANRSADRRVLLTLICTLLC